MKIFKTSREIPASPHEIFIAFSDPQRLAKWWGPAGFSNTINQFQFFSGGKWSFIMHGPDGRDYPNDSEFIEVVYAERVVIRHLSEPKFILSISITGSEQHSLVNWVQDFENEATAKNIAHIVEPSNEQNLDRLTAEVCHH